MGRRKGAAVAAILTITTGAILCHYRAMSRPVCSGLDLGGVKILRYLVEDITYYDSPQYNITNRTIQGSIVLGVSGSGRTFEIERVTDAISPSGPNATFSVDRRGNVTDILFEEVVGENSTSIFSTAPGSSFDFPEMVPLPEQGILVPQSWSAVIHFNYTLRITSRGSPPHLLRQAGFSRYDLEALNRTTVSTPAGTFNAIEIRYNKTVRWTTWEGRIPEDLQQGDQEESIGTGNLVIEPETGVILQKAWELLTSGSITRHAGTIRLVDYLPRDALATLEESGT